MNNRDNFTKKTKDIVAKRVAFKCSNPNCRKLTIGPHTVSSKTNNVGIAAHISAASKNGPRYNSNMTREERKSDSNAIWLCSTCSKLIDNDVEIYSKELLYHWKKNSEYVTFVELTNSYEKIETVDTDCVKSEVYHEVIEDFYSPEVFVYNLYHTEYWSVFNTDSEY